jgi:hypothetical protein
VKIGESANVMRLLCNMLLLHNREAIKLSCPQNQDRTEDHAATIVGVSLQVAVQNNKDSATLM